MKKSASDYVFTVFKIILLIATSVYLAYCIALMVTTEQETGWEALGFVLLLLFGIFVNGAAFFLSLIFFILSLVLKNAYVKKTDKESVGYAICLKRKKQHVRHFGLLMLYAVVSEALIFAVGAIIF